MRFTADRKELLAAATHAAKVAVSPKMGGRSDISDVQIEADTGAGVVRLAAWDVYDLAARITVGADVAEAGTVRVTAQAFADAVRATSGETVTVDDIMRGGTIVATGDAGGRAEVPTHTRDADEAIRPPAPMADVRGGSGPVAELADALRRVLLATSTNRARPILNAVRVERGEAGRMLLVATDSYRLHVATVAIALPDGWECVTLPRDQLRTMLGGLVKTGTVTFGTSPDGRVVVGDGRTVWSIRPVEGAYPDWRKLLPKDGPRVGKAAGEVPDGPIVEAIADRDQMRDALAPIVRAWKSAPKGERDNRHVRAFPDGADLLFEYRADGATTAARVAAQVQAVEEIAPQHYNVGFLGDAIAAMPAGNVRARWAGAGQPVELVDENRRTIVLLMPVRT